CGLPHRSDKTMSRLRSLRRVLRLSLTLGVLCGMLVGTTGFSVAPRMSLGGAFPCEGNGCGCQSAAECWLGCCCLTPKQRLAWARQHGVTPPPELVRLAETEQSKPARSCCGKHSKSSCCHRDLASPSPASKTPCCDEAAEQSPSEDERLDLVVSPLHCGG